MNKKLIIIIILSIASILRFFNIHNNPPALYGDELTIALDAYSLLSKGTDQLGNPFPITFEMGAGRPAGYIYFSIPFVALFGPTALGVRMLSILSGIGIIILLYLIGKKFFGEEVGLSAAAIAAISPWDISLSRGGFEAHFALFLALLGTYLFILARQKPIFYIFSAISFGLTLHTYPTYKISLLLFLPLLIWQQGSIRKLVDEKNKYFFTGVITMIILGILALSQIFLGGSETRFSNINIFSRDTLKASIEQKINLERQVSQLPRSFLKFFHNKPIEYSKVFIENYLQNFSLDFLILHGDRNPRHNMATMGQLLFTDMFLIPLGLISFWFKNRRTILFLVLWILLAPVATSTVDLPHTLRSSFMLPPLLLLSAAGLMNLFTFKNKYLLILTVFIFVVQFSFFAQKVYFLAPNEYSEFWSYPAKLASKIALENKNNYQYIVLSDKIDSIEYAYPVYAEIPAELIIDQNKKRVNSDYFKKFNNVYIGKVDSFDTLDFFTQKGKSMLFITSYEDRKILPDYETIQSLNKLDSLVIKKINH